MKRILDVVISFVALSFLLVPIISLAGIIKLTSKGPILYWSNRIGRRNVDFKMPKFRSMKIDTPEVASDLLTDPMSALTPIGNFLRKSSLDEVPQFWSVIKGDMSLVGPRPALVSQKDLIDLRTAKGVHNLSPGLTGLAQINGRDELTPLQKVAFDVKYLTNQNLLMDISIIWLTFIKVFKIDGVSH